MLRRIVTVPSIALSFTLAGCELIYDFEKPQTSAAGADAGGHASKGGNAGNVAGAGNKNGTVINASTTGGALSSIAGNGSTAISSGGTSGNATNETATNSVGATTSVDTSTAGGTASVVGAGGATSVVASGLGGGTTAGTSPTPIGGAATGGVATVIGTAGRTGVITGGAPTQGGAAGRGGAATGGVVSRGGTTATGGVATGGVATGGVATGGVATGGVATGGVATGGVATGGTSSDTTPPTVASISPLNGANGVASDATITIDFSEPMDKVSVKSALSVSGITSGDLSLQWNGNGNSVLITVTGGLQYAVGTSLGATAAKGYTVSLSANAKDTSGNRLSPTYSATFSTLRRITQSIAPTAVLGTDDYAWLVLHEGPIACTTDSVRVGGFSGSQASGTYFGFVVFNVAGLPSASSIYSLESAKFYGGQGAAVGGFYDAHAVILNKVHYSSQLDQAMAQPVTANLGTLSQSSATFSVALETLSAFKVDFLSGEANHMYKLEPSPNPPSWPSLQAASFGCDEFRLDATYLIE